MQHGNDTNTGVEQLNTLLEECAALTRQGKAEAEQMARSVLATANAIANDALIAKAYCLLSQIYHEIKFDDEKALAFADLAVQHTNSFEPGVDKIAALYQLATCYQYVHDQAKCITLLHECLRMFEFYNLNTDEYDLLQNGVNYTLGIAYINIGLFRLSVSYLQAALKYAIKINDPVLLKRSRITLANIHKYANENDKALEQYDVILNEYADQPENDQLALVYDYIGQIYTGKQDYEKAEANFLKAIAIRERIGNELRTAYSYFTYARMLFILERNDEGQVLFDKMKDIIDRNPERFDAQITNDIYYELYAAKGEYEIAYRYFSRMELAYVSTKVMESTLSNIFESERVKQLRIKEQADMLGKLNDEMSSYSKQLESTNKDLKTYAHTTSHDLREPLRMVSTYMTILEAKLKDKLSDEERVFLKFAVDGSKRMDEMITRILDSAKGNRSANFKPVNLNTLVDTVRTNLTRLITDKHAQVTNTELPIIIADDVQILQVVQNLVTNAIKYNKSEVPQIQISSVTDAGYHTISVADNGVGIPESERANVFEMFTRVENPSGADGTGIGLSTVKNIVEKMKGKIWIEGNQPNGSVFKIQLPVKAV